MLHKQGRRRDRLLHARARLAAGDLSAWERLVYSLEHPEHEVKIGMIGKYVDLSDSYKSLNEALTHAGLHTRTKVTIEYVDSETIEHGGTAALAGLDAILVPGGFGKRGTRQDRRHPVRRASNNVPYLGICWACSWHHRVRPPRVRTGRRQLHRVRSGNAAPVVALVTEWMDRTGRIERRSSTSDLGGTMRLGSQKCPVEPGTLAHRIYGDAVNERHRHRYEVNNVYVAAVRSQGHEDLGAHADRNLPEIMELPGHPFFVGVQFHPEFTSTARATAIRCSRLRRRRRWPSAPGAAACCRRWRLEARRLRRRAGAPFFLIAAPAWSRANHCTGRCRGRLKEITVSLQVPFVFKVELRQANRSSGRSFPGAGIDEGLRILAEVKRQVGVAVLTDVHARAAAARP